MVARCHWVSYGWGLFFKMFLHANFHFTQASSFQSPGAPCVLGMFLASARVLGSTLAAVPKPFETAKGIISKLKAYVNILHPREPSQRAQCPAIQVHTLRDLGIPDRHVPQSTGIGLSGL